MKNFSVYVWRSEDLAVRNINKEGYLGFYSIKRRSPEDNEGLIAVAKSIEFWANQQKENKKNKDEWDDIEGLKNYSDFFIENPAGCLIVTHLPREDFSSFLNIILTAASKYKLMVHDTWSDKFYFPNGVSQPEYKSYHEQPENFYSIEEVYHCYKHRKISYGRSDAHLGNFNKKLVSVVKLLLCHYLDENKIDYQLSVTQIKNSIQFIFKLPDSEVYFDVLVARGNGGLNSGVKLRPTIRIKPITDLLKSKRMAGIFQRDLVNMVDDELALLLDFHVNEKMKGDRSAIMNFDFLEKQLKSDLSMLTKLICSQPCLSQILDKFWDASSEWHNYLWGEFFYKKDPDFIDRRINVLLIAKLVDHPKLPLMISKQEQVFDQYYDWKKKVFKLDQQTIENHKDKAVEFCDFLLKYSLDESL